MGQAPAVLLSDASEGPLPRFPSPTEPCPTRTPEERSLNRKRRRENTGGVKRAGDLAGLVSGLDRVSSLSVLVLGGGDGQSEFLAYRAGQEAANRVRQPAGGLHQVLGSGAAGPFQQVQDLGSFAAVAGNLRFGDLALGAALGRFLGGRGVAGRLGLGGRNVGATWRNASLFVRFRLLAACCGCGGGVFFWNQRGHSFFSLRGLVSR